MSEIRIIALIVMVPTGINILWRLVKGAMVYSARNRGMITDEEEGLLGMHISRSLWVFGVIPFIIALIVFLVA